MTRTEIALTVGTALLAFVGALAGVYAGSRLEQSNWESRFQLEQRKLLLEKRAALVERVVIVLSKAPVMKGLQGLLKAETTMAELAMHCAAVAMTGKSLPPGCKGKPKADVKRVEELGKEIHALNGEWSAAASLAALYFGAATRQAIAEVGKVGVWDASDAQRQTVLNAMGQDLQEKPK